MRRVLTVGTFDLMHTGHLQLLDACRDLVGVDGKVHVGVNTDPFIERYRGRPPVMPYSERVRLISALRTVDHVHSNDQPDGTMRSLVEHVRPHIIAVGSDWLRRDYLGQIGLSPDYLDRNGISLAYITRPLDGPSSTKLRSALT